MVDKSKFLEEEAQGYTINIIGRNIQVTEAMKSYAWEKLSKIERFHNHIMHVTVTLDIQKLEHTVSIVLKIDHTEIKVQASSTDMYVSIEKAIDRLQAKLRRWNGRIFDLHHKKPAIVDMLVNVLQSPFNEVEEINAEIEAENRKEAEQKYRTPKVIGTETRPLKTLSAEEAVMKLELSGDSFLFFRDEADRRLKVLYRRKDGNYGLMQPEV